MDTRRITALLCSLIIGIAGCERVSRGELAQRVIEQDPSFAHLVEQRDTIADQVKQLRDEMRAERDAHQQQIRLLERAYQAARAEKRAGINGLRAQLRPAQDQIKLTQETLSHRMRIRKETVRGLQRTVGDLEKTLNGEMSPEEREARKQELVARRAELEQLKTLLAQHQQQGKLLDDKLRLLQVR